MLDILDVFEKLSTYKDNPWILNLIMVLILFACLKKSNHPRYRYRMIASFLLAMICFNLYLFEFLSLNNQPALCCIMVSLILVIASIFYSVKYPIGISVFVFRKLKRLEESGSLLEIENYLKATRRLLFTTAEKLKYAYSCQKLYLRMDEPNKSYKILQSIDTKKLFKNEFERIHIEMALDLFMMGSLKKAEHLLSKVESNDILKYRTLSMIYEQYGDIPSATEYLGKARLHLDNAGDSVKAQIYNNYGRIRLIEHNYTDALFHYRKAYECLKNAKSNHLRHVIYQNLIHTLYKNDPSNPEIDTYCKEYDRLPLKTEEDLFESIHFKIDFALQRNAIDNNLLVCVANGYVGIVSRLEGVPRYHFEVSMLQRVVHLGIRINVIMNDIRNDYNDYLITKMPDRFRLIKDLHEVLNNTAPIYGDAYHDIFAQCQNYLSQHALADLDTYYNGLEAYEVNARCNALRNKIACISQIKPYDFDFLLAQTKDITDIYESERMFIATTEYFLNIADTCIDRNHCDAQALCVMYPEIVAEYTGKAIHAIARLKNHPSVSVFHLRVAFYLLAIGEKEQSKAFFAKFNKADINFLPDWLMQAYFYTSQELSA